LLGLAVGDALGAPVEFLSLEKIQRKYGLDGITGFQEWSGHKPGSYTDDAQMSLATAVGCIRGKQRWINRGICDAATVVYNRYLGWLQTQDDPTQSRGPGNTCLTALRSGKMGTIEKKINDSKGCGGVMRTAPAGLAFGPEDAFRKGAEFAAITHGHPSGYLSAGFLSELIAQLVRGQDLAKSLSLSIKELIKFKGHEETLNQIELARELSRKDISINNAISDLGSGKVGEEALGISIYCSLISGNDWKKGTLAAVNHSGDSDSTGSITGAILGTLLGVESIPGQWVKEVENSAGIIKIADDMFKIFVKGEDLSFEEYPPN